MTFNSRAEMKRLNDYADTIKCALILIVCMAMSINAGEHPLGKCKQFIRTSMHKNVSFYAIAELNIPVYSERINEVHLAINMTQLSNPNMHYVFVTSEMDIMQWLVARNIQHYDLWYCPVVLYGTLFDVGLVYNGTKIAASIDNWWPPFNLSCSFREVDGNKNVAFLLSRAEDERWAPGTYLCTRYRGSASWDGVMFDHLDPRVSLGMRYPRSYWGCENLSGWVLQHFGTKLYNLCPFYAPVHIHKASQREFRVRVNHAMNTLESVGDDGLSKQCRL